MANDDSMVRIQITLDDGSVQQGFVRMEKKAEETASKMSGTFGSKQLFSGFLGTVGKVTAAVSAIATGFTLKKAIDEATQAESAIVKFNTSLASAGIYSKQTSDAFVEYANKLQGLVGIDNDVIVSNASLLVSIGKLSGEGLNRATSAAINMSKALDMDLNSAFMVVAKAANGSVDALGRYGIKVSDNVSKSEKFNQALLQLEQRFGGQASAATNTFGGSLNKLTITFNTFLESIGKLITGSPVIREMFNQMSKSFESLSKTVDSFGKTGAFDTFLKNMVNVAYIIQKTVFPVVEIFIRVLLNGLNAIATASAGIITVMLKVGQAINDYLISPIANFTAGAVAKLVSLYDKELAKGMVESNKAAVENVKSFFDMATTVAGDTTSAAWEKLVESSETALNTNISQSVDKFASNFNEKIQSVNTKTQELVLTQTTAAAQISESYLGIGDSFGSFTDGFMEKVNQAKNNLAEFNKSASDSFRQIGVQAFNGLGTMAGNAFAAFGKAIQKGEDAMGAFINSLLASMGQMAVQLGSQFILQGIAYMWAGLPNGAALIGAGAALATFGGILSGLGGGGGSPAGGGVSASPGGGGVSASPETTPASEVATTEPAKPQTRVEVNIAGSVFDSSETGLRIVDIINSTFDTQGTTVTAV